MFNTLFGIYLADRFDLKSDRIIWTETVEANSSSDVNLTHATNGSALKSNLSTLNYFATKYTVWTNNSIVDLNIKPDGEEKQSIKTTALTKRTESPLIPPIYIEADIEVSLTNNQDIQDDVFLVLDVLKINQNRVAEFLELGRSIAVAYGHIDIQTLGIEKYLTVTNNLLKALLDNAGGNITPEQLILPTEIKREGIKEISCRRL